MSKNVSSNLPSQGSIEREYLSNIVKKSVLGCLIKISISVLNLSTEWAKEPTIYGFIFVITLYSSKNDNKHPCEIKKYCHSVHFI